MTLVKHGLDGAEGRLLKDTHPLLIALHCLESHHAAVTTIMHSKRLQSGQRMYCVHVAHMPAA